MIFVDNSVFSFVDFLLQSENLVCRESLFDESERVESESVYGLESFAILVLQRKLPLVGLNLEQVDVVSVLDPLEFLVQKHTVTTD